MNLPPHIHTAVEPLFEALPLSGAMEALVVRDGTQPNLVEIVLEISKDPVIEAKPELMAGLWLYIDELDRSHTYSQTIHTPTGSYWHGIMHRREGDFSNSHYWFSKAGKHPAMAKIEGYDPHEFIDEVQVRHTQSPPDLVDLQRREWTALFEWCANNE